MKVFSFKAEEADLLRWKEEAHYARLTTGEWIRRKLNGGVPAAPALLAIVKPASRGCDHRLPPGTYCKRCERVKK